MVNKPSVKRNWRELQHVAIAGAALLGIILWLLFGATGLFAWNDYSRALQVKRAELMQLQAEQRALRNRQQLLLPGHVDPDLADELLRRDLNLLHPDDVVVPLH